MTNPFVRRDYVIRTLAIPPSHHQAADWLCKGFLLPHVDVPGNRLIVGAYVDAYAAFLRRGGLESTTTEHARAFAATPNAQRIAHETESWFASRVAGKDTFSISELATLLGITDETVKSWIRKRALKAIGPGYSDVVISSEAIVEACVWRGVKLKD